MRVNDLRDALLIRTLRTDPYRAQHLILVVIMLLVPVFLSGCSNFVDQDQNTHDPAFMVRLESNHSVGQTFVARHGGLIGLEIWLEPQTSSTGYLQLHLRSDPNASDDLAYAVLPLEEVTSPGFYQFLFSLPINSHNQYYYAFLDLSGEGAVQVGAAAGNSYLDGAAYADHKPAEAQLAFHLIYTPSGMVEELVYAAVQGFGLLVVAGLLYILPGRALLLWLWPSVRVSWIEQVGLAAGISIAFYPLLLLWTDLLGIHLGALYAWLPTLAGLGGVLWWHRKWRPESGWESLRRWKRSDAFWPDFTLLVILALVFGVRLLVVRTLDAPMWGDSVQHAAIAQLLVDHDGLFSSWEPYAPYQSLTVHYGFHTLVAIFSWFTGSETVKATLWVGQIINGLAVFTLYPLAVRLADGRRWAGVGAVLTAGLLSPMPAFYVNWGRYAQLAGQAVLPVALWWMWEATEEQRRVTRTVFLAGLVLAGMALCYYRMPLFYAPFALIWLSIWGSSRWGREVRRWSTGLGRLVLIAIIAGASFLPWGLRLIGGHLATALVAGVSNHQLSLQRVLADYRVWRDITTYVPFPLLIAVLMSLGWAVVRRRWLVVGVGLWVAALALWVAGRLVGFPAANMMQNFAVVIALYIPTGLLVGWLVAAITAWGNRLWREGWQWVWGGILLLLALAGVARQIRIVQPQFVMVTRPDTRAMAWIQKNVATDALFLVEGFRIYGGRSAVGSDAGWWIPLLAKRENTMPPQYALISEMATEEDYSQRVVELVARLEEISPASPEGVRLLCEWGITHVYVGQGQGKVGVEATQLYSPQELVEDPLFDEIYHKDRVFIFALRPQACDGGGW